MSSHQERDLDEFCEYYSNPDNFLAVLDEAGVDYAVVLAETAVITSALIPNDHVQQFAAGGKGRIIPFCTFNPYMVLNPAAELDRAVREHGFRGVKFYPTY
ncbi:MAG: amidohydrolase family protein, partial [Acidobacteria bacterium]|nr:amidohydrolase family protein [Acidobacteriota bacterium]